jgi:hypothetical protein
MIKTGIFIVSIFLFTGGGAYAQTDAAAQWKAIVTRNPVDGENWYRYGDCLYLAGSYPGAIDAFKTAMRIGTLPFSYADCAYAISRCYAAIKDREGTLDWLQHSFDLGYRYLMNPTTDSIFLPFWGLDRFKKIVGIPLREFRTREEGWSFDLHLLQREIKRRGVNPYRLITEKQLDSSFTALEQGMARLTDLQMTLGIMKIMRLVGDGHTMVYAFYERPEFLRNLPFNLYDFKEGIFITEADARYRDLLGCQLMALDGRPVAEILKGLDPILNRDNEMGSKIMGLFRMRTLPLLYGLGLIDTPDSVTVTVKDTGGHLRKLRIAGACPIPTRRLWDNLPDSWVGFFEATHREPPDYLKHPYDPYWFEYLGGQHTVYFQYTRVSSERIPFDHFCDSLFDFIQSHEVDKLVLDLRLNNGGNTRLLPYLLTRIMAATKINKRGHFFVIIGRRTFSAAQNCATYLERFTQAVFVGEPTGSSPNFIGEELPFQLPYSKLMANVSDRYWQCSWPEDQREWLPPSYYIDPSFEDFAAGKDPDLEAIFAFNAY